MLSDPPPIVRLEAIEQWGFQFLLIAWVHEAHTVWRIASELRFAITRALGARGIRYPVPELLLHTARSQDEASADPDGPPTARRPPRRLDDAQPGISRTVAPAGSRSDPLTSTSAARNRATARF